MADAAILAELARHRDAIDAEMVRHQKTMAALVGDEAATGEIDRLVPGAGTERLKIEDAAVRARVTDGALRKAIDRHFDRTGERLTSGERPMTISLADLRKLYPTRLR